MYATGIRPHTSEVATRASDGSDSNAVKEMLLIVGDFEYPPRVP